MKRPFWFGLAATLLAGGMPHASAQVPAIVIADRINVRSRPSVSRGEIITQLARDQKVIVFEEGLPSASPQESVNDWTRIELPAGSPVWVASDHVTLPAGTVKAQRLNVRAGPSEDYGILGTVSQGATLRSLEQRDGWLKIEAPLGLSGYVASTFLRLADEATPQPPSPPRAPAEAQPPTAVSSAAPSAGSTNLSGTAGAALATPAIPARAAAPPAPAPEQPPSRQPVVEPASPPSALPPSTAPPGTVTASGPSVAELPVPQTSEEVEMSAAPRIVRREGIVRTTLSVQAPTPFALDAADNGKLLNYLLPLSTNVVIRPFRGQRVHITGEEYLEPRWENAPVIVVHQIKLAP